jgi:hypothetical protein
MPCGLRKRSLKSLKLFFNLKLFFKRDRHHFLIDLSQQFFFNP